VRRKALKNKPARLLRQKGCKLGKLATSSYRPLSSSISLSIEEIRVYWLSLNRPI
jgi:hypothetical protein